MPRSAFGARPRTLTGRLLLWHAVAVLGVLLVLGLVVDRVLEHYFVEQLTDSLVSDGRAVQQALPSSGDLQPAVLSLGEAFGARVTIIRTDGVVLADSEADPATMENHRSRPEVAQALSGRIGESSRNSATVGVPFRYVALPPLEGRIVRVALPLDAVGSRLRTVRLILAVGFGLAALAGLLVLWVVARGVSGPLRRLASAVEGMGRVGEDVHPPEEGTEEIALLADTVNTMRGEVAGRIHALEEERRARDAILSALDEGVVLFDREGTVLYQNDQARRVLGPSVTHARNISAPALREAVAQATEGEAAGMVEVVIGPRSRTIQATAEAVPSEGQVLMVLRDVTEARMVDAVRRDFVANASHELKTPVASIRALAETISSASEEDPLAVPRFAVQLDREAIRLARIISDLLDLSRLEGETGSRSELRFDLLVEREAGQFADSARQAELSFAVTAGSPVTVTGSERDLGLLVRNLVDNAVQYTRPGGRVDISVRSEGHDAVVEVRDTGPGIPRKDQTRVFERFYRVDRARSRETGGTGLGLSIVKHVAENHGGTVTIESELGRGSIFTVRLPSAG
jgi:two-component system phosphate regulon sensor histidine kinase PhoR